MLTSSAKKGLSLIKIANGEETRRVTCLVKSQLRTQNLRIPSEALSLRYLLYLVHVFG
jgi:hypothetical protein